MSLQTRRELVGRWRAEYASARKKRKGEILDLLCQETGWNRKHAVEALRSLAEEGVRRKRRRRKEYGVNEEAALVKVWRLSGFLASKRLAPFMGEFLESLERHDELRLPEPTRSKLAKMSASTMDRLLRRHRRGHARPASLTRPGSLLKREVAVRTSRGWDDDRPGYLEIDSVAHCGGSLEGEFFWTLSVTDVCTGWFESGPLRSKGHAETLRQLRRIKARLPFRMLGLDSDNGSEFLNWHLVGFCKAEGIQFTRCRPYHKNDQCRVEQKNSSVVRRHTGYGRYGSERQHALLSQVHGLLRLLVNFFEPSLKGKERAMTPYRRLLASNVLDEASRGELERTYLALNPVALRKELQKAKMELLGTEGSVGFLDEASE